MQNQKHLKKELDKLFNTDGLIQGGIDEAIVWVSSNSVDGRGWTSYRTVKKAQLKGRKYVLSQHHTRTIEIHFTDTVYNPETYSWSRPLADVAQCSIPREQIFSPRAKKLEATYHDNTPIPQDYIRAHCIMFFGPHRKMKVKTFAETFIEMADTL